MPANTATETDILIGKIIRERREALRMTQVALGDQIGVTFQQVQKYERGVNRVSAATLMRVAAALDCNVADLYDDPDPTAISTSERAILKLWQDLSAPQRDAVIALIRTFLKP